ncbi:MAG: hypothetical protein ACN4GM_15020 [Gammaproteobacteria bacterium]
MKQVTWWWLSAATSAVLIIVLINLWIQMNEYEIQPTQLVNEQAADDYINSHWEKLPERSRLQIEPTIKIKTGIFIQSLQFFNSSEVNLTGYIWQRYKNGEHDTVKPKPSEVGFILPEQVNSGGDIEPREIYRVRNGDEEVIGWYFEATLRQPFDYSHYPFDHKTVWVRMWPKNFSQNVVLVPDFDAYKSTGLSDIFGIEENIVLGTWERENTYFDYKLSSYDTDFGIADYIGQEGFPELHYNFVVKRKFENAFIVYLLPLFLVAALLFALLLTVSENDELSNRLGFSASGFIGASSALFFVVMLAHIQLREQFAGTSIVYIEYFYILMYALLVSATANTFLFSIRATRWTNIILYHDNIIPKVAYWPVVFASLIVITWIVL